MDIKTIEFKSQLVLKVFNVDNRLTTTLAPDTYADKEHKCIAPFAIVCDLFGNCIRSIQGPIEINITKIVKLIRDKIENKMVPFSAIATNYQGGGHFHFQLVADSKVVLNVNETLDQWVSKQYVVMIQQKV